MRTLQDGDEHDPGDSDTDPQQFMHPSMPITGDTRLSGLAKQLAPMIASMLMRELREVEMPHKTRGRKSQLKKAVEQEKGVENPEERSAFLVSATDKNITRPYKCMNSALFVDSSAKFSILKKIPTLQLTSQYR